MKDLGVADVILEIKISRTSNGLILSQSHCVKKLLYKFLKVTITLSKHQLTEVYIYLRIEVNE
jgi:hypothetical protein